MEESKDKQAVEKAGDYHEGQFPFHEVHIVHTWDDEDGVHVDCETCGEDEGDEH